MPANKLYVGDAAIRKGIQSLTKVMGNVNDRVQDLAVSIITHAAGPGNGDMSRALDLCKAVARSRTLNVAYLVGFFRYFGNANINLRANDGAGKVSLIARDAKAYRGGFDVEGAKHNRWDEAFAADGVRAKWYSGPEPAAFEPMGVGDIAGRMQRFVDNTKKLLDKTETVNGKEVPAVQLSEGDQQQVTNALQFLERIAHTLARHEDVTRLKAEAAKLEAEKDEEVEAVIQPQEKMVA